MRARVLLAALFLAFLAAARTLTLGVAVETTSLDPHFHNVQFNHSTDSSATGVETFYATAKVPPESAWTWIGLFSKPEPVTGDNGEDLAGYIQTSLVTRTDAANRGIKARELYVVRHTRCPAVLVEGGFINNPLEARLVGNADYRDRLASAIAEGVMTYQKNRARPVTPPEKLAQSAH